MWCGMKTLWSEVKTLWGNHFGFSTSHELLENLEKDTYMKIERARCRSNIQRIILFSLALILFQTVNLIFIFLTDFQEDFKEEYFLASCILLCGTIAFLLIIKIRLLKKEDLEKDLLKGQILYRSFWGFYVLSSIIFCSLESMERMTFVNYVLLLVVLAIIPSLKWFESVLYIGAALIAQCGLWFSPPAMNIEDKLFCILIAVMAFVVSHMLYTSFITVNVAHNQLKKLAETDSLTNLLNRRGFEKN
jgi:hypothetical protein